MPYIRLDQIEFSIGTQVLLDTVNLTLALSLIPISAPTRLRRIK